MASFLNKIRMKSAQNKQDYKDFTHQHLTTQNFCQIMPITNTELVPQSKVSCRPSSFCRFEPMPQPTFMKVSIINRAFFVPYELVWKPFHAFITRTPFVTSIGATYPTSVPTISQNALNKFFFDNMHPSNQTAPYDLYSDEEIISSNTPLGQFINNFNDGSNIADLVWLNYSAGPEETHSVNAVAKLSSKGRLIMKILESLGYKVDTTAYAYDNTDAKSFKYSALPLLCYAKVFLDWYYPTQYSMGTDVYNYVDMILTRTNSFQVNVADLTNIFNLVTKFFSEDSYFVNAFDHPFTEDTYNPNFITSLKEARSDSSVVPYNSVEIQQTVDGQPVIKSEDTPANVNPVSSWAVAAVGRLGSWLHRNQLAGAKIIDRFLARYGVQLPEEKLGRCYYLGEQKFSAMFSDVMCTAESKEASLGEYAGKGIAFDDSKTFEFNADEFGQFIVTNVVFPHVSYCQGFDRQLLHLSPFDFYQPEFDGLGMQAVYKGELITARNSRDIGIENVDDITRINDDIVDFHQYAKYINQVFGFQPRYSEYKCPRDKQTGNFSNPTTNRALPAWTANRYFQLFKFGNEVEDAPGSIELVKNYIPDFVHSADFMADDGIQYLRLFYQNYNSMDYINFVHTFDMHITAPILPLYDSFEFESDKDKKDITISGQGSKLS